MFDVLRTGVPAYNLPSASFVLTASYASEFYLDNQTLTTSSNATISVDGVVAKQKLTFWLNNVDYPYTLIDGYTNTSIFSTNVGTPVQVDVQFDGTQWALDSVKKLALESEPTIAQDPDLAGMGLVLDIDPTKYYSLHLSGSSVRAIDAVNQVEQTLIGAGHAPTWDRNGWNPGVPALVLTGSANPSDTATQYLFNGNGSNDLYSALSCDVSTWAAWTIFVVFQLDQIESEVSFVNFTTLQNQFPDIFIYSDSTDVRVAVYNDPFNAADSVALGSTSVGKHVVDVSADGVGFISGSLDGGSVSVCNDVRPKTVGGLSIGTAWLTGPSRPADQLNGKIARVLVFNQNLDAASRTHIRQLLANRYGLSI